MTGAVCVPARLAPGSPTHRAATALPDIATCYCDSGLPYGRVPAEPNAPTGVCARLLLRARRPAFRRVVGAVGEQRSLASLPCLVGARQPAHQTWPPAESHLSAQQGARSSTSCRLWVAQLWPKRGCQAVLLLTPHPALRPLRHGAGPRRPTYAVWRGGARSHLWREWVVRGGAPRLVVPVPHRRRGRPPVRPGV